MFRMSRASLLAHLPLYCSAECATPTNTSLFLQIIRGIWPMPLSLLNHSALALFAQRTRIPTSARSIGICVIWVCISSSFLPCRRMELLDRKRRNFSTLSFNTSRLPVCSLCATATKTLTRLGTPHGSRHSGVNGFPLQLQPQMRPSLTASYRPTEGFCFSARWPFYCQGVTVPSFLQLRPQAKPAIV